MKESKPRDLHHIFYPAASYATQAGSRLREHRLMVVRLPITTHIDLHRQLEPNCILLDTQTAIGVYHEIGQLELSSCIEPLEIIDVLAKWLTDKGVFDLATNLIDQQEFFNEATHISARELAKRRRQWTYHRQAGRPS